VDYRKLFPDLQRRPGMFALDGSFGQFRAFLTGVDAGHDWQFLTGFRELLVTRAGTGSNLTWTGVVVRLAFRISTPASTNASPTRTAIPRRCQLSSDYPDPPPRSSSISEA
jgi:hypothetical protein